MTIISHLEVDDSTCSEMLMLEEAFLPIGTINLHAAYVTVLRTVCRRIDLEVLTILQM